MQLEDLIGLLPPGLEVEIVERKHIADGKIVKAETVEIALPAGEVLRFNSVDDVATALKLATAFAGTVAAAPPPVHAANGAPATPAAQEDAPAGTPAAEDEVVPPEVAAWLADEDAAATDEVPPEPVAEAEAGEQTTFPMPPPAAPAPTSTVTSQFQSRLTSRRPEDKRPLTQSTSILQRV